MVDIGEFELSTCLQHAKLHQVYCTTICMCECSPGETNRSILKVLSPMAWPFCPQCRATLTVDSSGRISCGCCQYESNLSFMRDNLPSNTTVSPDTPMANWARSEEEQARVAAASNAASRNRATVEEPCIQCGHPEVGFYTVQLRSVDEGQTVFYECPACKHTWSVNN